MRIMFFCKPHKNTVKVKTVDFSKAIKDLNHDPDVPPEEGIQRTVAWMKWFYRI